MKIILIIFGVTLTLLAILFVYYGGLRKIYCRIKEQGGEIHVYKQKTGDYTKSAKRIDEIYHSMINDY